MHAVTLLSLLLALFGLATSERSDIQQLQDEEQQQLQPQEHEPRCGHAKYQQWYHRVRTETADIYSGSGGKVMKAVRQGKYDDVNKECTQILKEIQESNTMLKHRVPKCYLFDYNEENEHCIITSGDSLWKPLANVDFKLNMKNLHKVGVQAYLLMHTMFYEHGLVNINPMPQVDFYTNIWFTDFGKSCMPGATYNCDTRVMGLETDFKTLAAKTYQRLLGHFKEIKSSDEAAKEANQQAAQKAYNEAEKLYQEAKEAKRKARVAKRENRAENTAAYKEAKTAKFVAEMAREKAAEKLAVAKEARGKNEATEATNAFKSAFCCYGFKYSKLSKSFDQETFQHAQHAIHPNVQCWAQLPTNTRRVTHVRSQQTIDRNEEWRLQQIEFCNFVEKVKDDLVNGKKHSNWM